MKFKRIFVLILDSLGVGEALDANNYGDNGANTLKHIMENYDLFIPNLEKLGFLNTITMDDRDDVDAYYTIARPTNVGKDSLTGHYELMGLKNETPFKTFTETGFPKELIDELEQLIIDLQEKEKELETLNNEKKELIDYADKILIIDIGHHESENCTKDIFYHIITEKFPIFAVRYSQTDINPINYL